MLIIFCITYFDDIDSVKLVCLIYILILLSDTENSFVENF